MKASPRKKRNPPSTARGHGKRDEPKFGIARAGAGRGCGCSKHWDPRAPADQANTYEAAEHGAGNAGGQAHGRGRSGPAHMSPEPLRCPPVPDARRITAAGPPGAAAATRRQARWRRGLRAAPARLSPPLHNGASPAPPSGTSAEGRGARRGERPGPREKGAWGRILEAPPTAPGSSLLAVPSGRVRRRPQGTSGGFRSLGGGTAPRPRQRVRQALLHSFTSHILSEPAHTPLFTLCPHVLPTLSSPSACPEFPR